MSAHRDSTSAAFHLIYSLATAPLLVVSTPTETTSWWLSPAVVAARAIPLIPNRSTPSVALLPRCPLWRTLKASTAFPHTLHTRPITHCLPAGCITTPVMAVLPGCTTTVPTPMAAPTLCASMLPVHLQTRWPSCPLPTRRSSLCRVCRCRSGCARPTSITTRLLWWVS